ncbi:MAG TPA: HDOD domain-containing protein [Fimbriimonadaceae bacterium]
MSRNGNFSTLPQIVSSALHTMNSEDVSVSALEKIIERDPAIASKVLRTANSSFYGCKDIPTLGRAMSVLGLNTVRSLIVSVTFQQMSSEQGQCPSFDRFASWRHSIAVAIGAKMIAKMKMPMKAEELYSAGILHDVGLLVFDRFAGQELDHAIKHAFNKNIPLVEAEQEVMGCNHCEIGAKVGEKWGLPDRMTRAMAYHVCPGKDDTCFDTTCIIALAEGLATQFGFPNNSPEGAYKIDPSVEQRLAVTEQEMILIGRIMHEEVKRAQESFQLAA